MENTVQMISHLNTTGGQQTHTQSRAQELEVPSKRNVGVSHCFQGKKRKGLTLIDFIMLFVQCPLGTELQNQSKYNGNENIIKHISVGPALQWKSKGLEVKKTQQTILRSKGHLENNNFKQLCKTSRIKILLFCHYPHKNRQPLSKGV